MVRLVPARHFTLHCSHDLAVRLGPAMRDQGRARASMVVRVSGRNKPPAMVVDSGYFRFAVPLLAGAERSA
jgi:hypothetical protein